MEQFRTTVTAREGGDYLVERQQQFGSTWATVDRYKTATLAKLPTAKDRSNGRKLKREGKDGWIKDAVKALSQPSAGIVIEVPPVPPIEINIFERNKMLIEACDVRQDTIERLCVELQKPLTPCPCNDCVGKRESGAQCQQTAS